MISNAAFQFRELQAWGTSLLGMKSKSGNASQESRKAQGTKLPFLEESHLSKIKCLAYVCSLENYSWDFQSSLGVENPHPRWMLQPTLSSIEPTLSAPSASFPVV